MNSSSAASMMACRRSAARWARLDGGAFGKAGFGALAKAAFPPRRRLAGFAGVLAAGIVRDLDIDTI
jgi:hypothetical protein